MHEEQRRRSVGSSWGRPRLPSGSFRGGAEDSHRQQIVSSFSFFFFSVFICGGGGAGEGRGTMPGGGGGRLIDMGMEDMGRRDWLIGVPIGFDIRFETAEGLMMLELMTPGDPKFAASSYKIKNSLSLIN